MYDGVDDGEGVRVVALRVIKVIPRANAEKGRDLLGDHVKVDDGSGAFEGVFAAGVACSDVDEARAVGGAQHELGVDQRARAKVAFAFGNEFQVGDPLQRRFDVFSADDAEMRNGLLPLSASGFPLPIFPFRGFSDSAFAAEIVFDDRFVICR